MYKPRPDDLGEGVTESGRNYWNLAKCGIGRYEIWGPNPQFFLAPGMRAAENAQRIS